MTNHMATRLETSTETWFAVFLSFSINENYFSFFAVCLCFFFSLIVRFHRCRRQRCWRRRPNMNGVSVLSGQKKCFPMMIHTQPIKSHVLQTLHTRTHPTKQPPTHSFNIECLFCVNISSRLELGADKKFEAYITLRLIFLIHSTTNTHRQRSSC